MTTTRPTLYVHVADDGGLLTIDGPSGRSAWVTEAELARRLDALSQIEGAVLLSREFGSPLAAAVIELIEATGLPVSIASEVHPDAVRRGRVTALMSASFVGAMGLLEDLLRRGADVGVQDDQGYTALMYASNAGEIDAVKMLVAAEADVNQADRSGSTALMFAAQHGHLGVAKRLLAAGADPKVRRTVDGMTARDLAVRNGHQRLAAVLATVERRPS